MTSQDNKIKLIITDDHRLFRTGVRTSLAKHPDIEIIGEAENGQQLLQLLDHLMPDMVILGIQMPVMDGITALPILKKRYPHIKVIMLSMHNDPSVICKTLELGANTYLTKEAGSGEIYENIQALRNRLLYINDTVKKAITNLKSAIAPFSPAVPSFSEKEILIMKMLKMDISVSDIANIVDLSPRTVLAIIDKMKGKVSVKTTADLVVFAEKKGLFSKDHQ